MKFWPRLESDTDSDRGRIWARSKIGWDFCMACIGEGRNVPAHFMSVEGAYRCAPKASRRPSQSFTTNSREFHGMLAIPRANSTPRAAYSA
jgi:hypothetical protein